MSLFLGKKVKRNTGMQGDLRIVYSVNREEKTVLIEAIGPRGDIYK